jgi:hypothetical protein
MSRVISGSTGLAILCCWTDCERVGDDRHRVVLPEPRGNLIYLFCSERHREYWRNSHHSMGNLPSGAKSLGGPVGGWNRPTG